MNQDGMYYKVTQEYNLLNREKREFIRKRDIINAKIEMIDAILTDLNGMTREEAIEYLTILGGIGGITDNEAMALEIAIEALEQEPVIDKIKAEIDEHIEYNKRMNYMGLVGGLLLAKAVFDKYKTESEEGSR